MAINFNTIPTEKPSIGTIIPKGTYIGTIVKAEMKTPKYDDSKPDYLSIQMKVTDPASNTEMGTIFPVFTESEAPLPRYQLGRFIKALGLPITGEFELKDLTKMVVNKQLRVDICPEKTTDGSDPKRSVVDIDAECYYPLVEDRTESIANVFAENTEPSNTAMATSSY